MDDNRAIVAGCMGATVVAATFLLHVAILVKPLQLLSITFFTLSMIGSIGAIVGIYATVWRNNQCQKKNKDGL